MVTENLNNLAIVGIKNLVFRDKTSNEVIGDINTLVSINMADEMSSDFLKGGYNNPNLLTIYGDREATFTGTTATMSSELLKVLTSTETEEKEVEEEFIEQMLVTQGVKKIVLKEQPIADYLEVYPLDLSGKKLDKVEATIGTKELTLATAPTENTNYIVYYRAKVNVKTQEMKNIAPKTYDLSALTIVREIETQELKKAWIRIPCASVQPKYQIAGKNEASASAPIELVIDCLPDTHLGFPYAIDFDNTYKAITCGMTVKCGTIKVGQRPSK